MRSFILSLPGKLQAAFVIGATIAIAFLSAIVCSLCFDHHQLTSNTDLISSVYQAMGTIYAILLTFTLWGVWQNFTDAGKSVQIEAYTLLDLVHMMESSATLANNHVKQAALDYLRIVVQHEWSSLKTLTNEQINQQENTHNISRDLVDNVQNIKPQNEREMIIYNQALSLLTRWLDARRTRMLIARGDSARALWPLLFTGAFVLFAFHGLFVANTIAIWAMLLFGTSLVVGVTFYLIFTLDCPFAGSLSIDAEPYTFAIKILCKDRKSAAEIA